MTEKALRQQIIDACLRMNGLGINQGTSGNVSARVRGGLLITPSGVPYEALKPADIVKMRLDGAWSGRLQPSSEWRFHVDIMAAKPEVQAIVHTHSVFATTVACLRKPIPAVHYMVAVAGGDSIPCADYATFGTQALSDNAIAALQDRTACLLANHGVIATGASIDKALALAVEVETLARMYWQALQAGTPTILGPDEMARVVNKFRSYGKQPARDG